VSVTVAPDPRRALRGAPAVGWMAVLWASSSRPWPQAGSWLRDVADLLPRWALAAIAFVPADKIVHSVLYAVLALLWLFALPGRPPRVRAAIAWVAATGFGACDELHQAFVPGRSCDVWDLCADATGAGIAVAAFLAWARLWGRAG